MAAPLFSFSAMGYANRLKGAHDRIRARFGTDVDDAQLYVWHAGVQITAYQPSGTRSRDILAMSLAKNETITVCATKDEFTTAPKSGDAIKMGTALATAHTLRIESVQTTHVRPFYELQIYDPNKATTADAA